MEVARRGGHRVQAVGAVVLLASVATGCSDDAHEDPAVEAPAGEEFGVTYPDGTTLPITFVLRDEDGTAVYLLSPARGDEEPSAEPIESTEFGRPAAGLLVDDGSELRFSMPANVDPGRFRLCADDDTCIALEVK